MKTKLCFSLVALGIAATLLLTGCEKKKGCTDPNATNYNVDAEEDDGSCTYPAQALPTVKLHFHPKVGSASLAYNTDYTDSNGRKYQFTKVQFYVSNLRFHDHEMTDATPSNGSYLLVNPSSEDYELGTVDSTHYHKIKFSIGVDSIANHADPTTNETHSAISGSNSNFAHWGWNSGYRFIVLEGLVDTTAAGNSSANFPFSFHIGLDALLRDVEFTKHFEANTNSTHTFMIDVDYARFFDGIDLRTENNTNSMGDFTLAQKVADNVTNVFSLN